MLSYDAGAAGLPKAIRRFFYLCCALCSVEAPGFSRSMGFDPIMTTPLPIGSVCLADLGMREIAGDCVLQVAAVSYEFAAFHTILA